MNAKRAPVLPCLWSCTGIAPETPCESDFACESCPVYRSLLAERGPGGAPFPRTADAYPTDRSYHPAHCWAAAAGRGRARIGLDAFAAETLGRVLGIILPPDGSHLARGRTGFWVVVDSEPVSIASPVDGVTTAANPLLREDPRVAVEDPYGAGWVLEATLLDPVSALHTLLDGEEARARAALDLASLRRATTRTLSSSAAVGARLADGGERLRDLRDMLGVRRYLAIVTRLLRGTAAPG